ncbi:inner membrane-spanning protein YciB [Candidatus Kinetoplastidibacterium blastocrithidiae]|nr:septation protein IspZ [Candidatus Kinetoplastibacterium blastocrithidii]
MYTNNIYFATKAIVFTCIFQLAYIKFFHVKINKTNIMSNLIIILLGGTTIFLENDLFIKTKPTIVYWILGLTIFFYRIALNRNIVCTSLKNKIKLPKKIWDYINKLWICFFIIMGCINIFIAFSGFFSEKEWVLFKIIGSPLVFIVFILIQLIIFKKHISYDNE